MRNLYAIALLLVAATISIISTTALGGERTTGDSANVELIGRWARGPSFAVDAIGTVAYFGDGAILRIVDFAVPESPVELGSLVLPGPIFDIEVVSGIAYVADWDDGLRIVNVSDPAFPTEIGFFDTDGLAQGVAVVNTLVFIADGENGMPIIDVSTPGAPFEAGRFAPPGDWIWAVAASGSQALATGFDGELRVVDVSTPAAPIEVGNYDHGNIGYGVDVSGDLAFVAAGQFVTVVDFSNPGSPYRVTNELLGSNASSVILDGDHLYVGVGWNGLEVVELAISPADTTVNSVGVVDTEGYASDVAVGGGFCFVSDRAHGLRAMDVSDPASPVEAGFYDTVGQIHGAAIADDYAYLTDRDRGLHILDLSGGSDPVHVGQVDIPDVALDVVVKYGYAYVAANLAGLRIIDVSDPADPFEVGSVPTGWSTQDVAVRNNRAYLAEGGDGIRVIDITDKSAPFELGRAEPANGNCRRIVVNGTHAFTPKQGWGISVFDVTNSSDPHEVGSLDFGDLDESAWGVAVEGDYLYVADHGAEKIFVVDISDPTDPFQVAERITAGRAEDLFAHNGFLYVATYDDGLRVFDITNPAVPDEVGRYDTGDEAYSLAVGGTRILIADDQDGLWVLGNMLATPVFLASFTANAEPGAVSLRWEASGANGSEQFRLTRGSGAAETELAWSVESPGVYSARDAASILRGGGSFEYRLHGREAGEMWQLLRSESVELAPLPAATELQGAWPNPFNPKTTIRFRIAEAGPVELTIHDAGGALVARLLSGPMAAGEHEVSWGGRDGGGNEMGSGVYFVKLRARGSERSGKLTLLR